MVLLVVDTQKGIVDERLYAFEKFVRDVYKRQVDHAFAEIHCCKQEILAGSGTLQEKLRAVIIAMPTEYLSLIHI